ncbi:MAG: amidohydrolase family protein [Phycisphaerales bacterium]|nr:amidohydrolase family protein [Phycisphaerales bacterium]
MPIIDAHTHINGERAAVIYAEVRELFGVTETWSQTQFPQAKAIKNVLGDSIHFVAVPDYMSQDPGHAHGQGYLDRITEWHEAFGVRMLKFWCAPRGRDYAREVGNDPLTLTLESPWRRKQMDHAAKLGFMFMAHIADPDTWFQTKYADASIYGTKASQYTALEKLADEYDVPWLIAHMGGWPEDLSFLTGLLERHANLILDTSATKWMVRELSKHPRTELLTFLHRFRGRILFGSDIVTMDAHLSSDTGPRAMGVQASSQDEAFELYASRYWALRTLFETDYVGESPIADPDLHLVAPDRYTDMDAPPLAGKALPKDELVALYRQATLDTLHRWHGLH